MTVSETKYWLAGRMVAFSAMPAAGEGLDGPTNASP